MCEVFALGQLGLGLMGHGAPDTGHRAPGTLLVSSEIEFVPGVCGNPRFIRMCVCVDSLRPIFYPAGGVGSGELRNRDDSSIKENRTTAEYYFIPIISITDIDDSIICHDKIQTKLGYLVVVLK